MTLTGANGESNDEGGASIDTVSFFSAYGPTTEGRIKPELVAPGDQASEVAISMKLTFNVLETVYRKKK